MDCRTNCTPQRNSFSNVFHLSIVLLLALLLTSCGRVIKPQNFAEGYIEYSIEYDDSLQPQNFNANMRPNKMIIKFKDSNTINKIEGLSGAFSFAFIQNNQTQKAYILIKLLNKKLYYQEDLTPNAFPFAYNNMPKFTLHKLTEVEEFMGYSCKRAIACYSDSTLKPFNVLYTNEIGISNPNANTPFHDIDGIMLKFSAIMFNHKMNVQASTIKAASIPDEEFFIPRDYEEVGIDVVKDVIDLLK